MKKYDIYAIGNPLMDIHIKTQHENLLALNLKKGEMHLIDEDDSTRLLDKVKNNIIKTTPGGSAVNVATAMARLGGVSVFCGAIGYDEHGDSLENSLIKDGIIVNIAKNNKKTGHAITFVTPDSERTFATHLGAALELKKEHIKEEEIIASKILHIEAYQLEDPNLNEVCIHAMKIAKENNVKVSIDLSDPALIKRNLEDFKKIIRDYADIVFANEEEAKAFTDLEHEEALHKIKEDIEIAVMKLGEKGSIIEYNGNVYRIEAFKANAVDTTGAGDMYAAGFLYGLCKGYDIEKCGKIGSYFGAKIVEQIGARLEHDLKKDLEKFK